MGEIVTVTRRTGSTLDEYGNPTYTTETIDFPGCLVAWGATDEPSNAAENPVATQVTLYMPPNSEIHDGDMFTVRGDLFIKDGFAQKWISTFNVPQGVVVVLRKHDG